MCEIAFSVVGKFSFTLYFGIRLYARHYVE